MTITRACYATREEVRAALDVQMSAYANNKLDRHIQMGSGSVDRLCMRRFYTTYGTYQWDWPNYQYAYPWRLWLDKLELAGPPTLVVSGTFLPEPVVIPESDYLLYPTDGPPYRALQLRRDMNSSFGNNTTPQFDIGITGPFGYWLEVAPAGQLAANVASTTTGFITVTNSGALGVGDTVIAGSEQMLVTDASYINTGIDVSSGCTTASAADNTMVVPDGTQFSTQEIILVDSEWMLVQYIIANNLIVKRGFSGSVLATHSPSAPIYAQRQFSVTRGFLGTTPTTYTDGTALSIVVVPDLVKELAVAEAATALIQEPSGYAYQMVTTTNFRGVNSGGEIVEALAGLGLPDLRQRCVEAYGRQARTRVV
jgi:hypothetical protein